MIQERERETSRHMRLTKAGVSGRLGMLHSARTASFPVRSPRGSIALFPRKRVLDGLFTEDLE
jgi:hypothetical protein